MTARRLLTALLIAIGVTAAAGFLALDYLVEDAHPVNISPASPFYEAPTAVPTRPGSLVRFQQAPVPTSIGAPAGSTAKRIIYSSLDFRTGRPIALSATLYLPPGQSARTPLIAWSHGTTGVASSCAPSLVAEPKPALVAGIGLFLSRGWAVVAPDYQGLGTQGPHPYLVGVSEGRAVLDSIRAARNLQPHRIDARTVIWGHSQGGGAALWAGQIASSYSPDVAPLGVAAAAPASELAAIMHAQGNSLTSALLGSLVLWSWSRTLPGADLDKVTDKSTRKMIDSIASRCSSAGTGLLEDLPVGLAEQATGAINENRLLADPGWAAQLKANSVPISGAGPPLLIAQGTKDTVIHPQVTAGFVKALCAAGRSVNSIILPGATHPKSGVVAAPQVATWAAGLFSGSPAAGNCPA
jgi:alpha-beta hydrolase superfamily lysophospholipase